jgi:hypothetical protein
LKLPLHCYICNVDDPAEFSPSQVRIGGARVCRNCDRIRARQRRDRTGYAAGSPELHQYLSAANKVRMAKVPPEIRQEIARKGAAGWMRHSAEERRAAALRASKASAEVRRIARQFKETHKRQPAPWLASHWAQSPSGGN